MAELTVGVVGCGGTGNVHLGCWANVSGARIVAVCDRNGSRAAQTAAQYEGAAAFTSVKDLLSAQTVDVVDVCTPAIFQYDAARAALHAGAHVLCETPFTGSPEEADALSQLASERERLLMPAFCHRFHPPLLFAKELLDNDDIGSPTMFRSRFSGVWNDAPVSTEDGRGALMLTGIHSVDLFRWFCGEVVSVSGKVLTANRNLKVDDTAALLLEGKRAVGVVETSWSTPGGRNDVEIYGTAGACLADYEEGIARYLTADHPVWRRHDASGLNRFERMISHFADVVRGLQTQVLTAEDGVRAVALCDEVYRQNSIR